MEVGITGVCSFVQQTAVGSVVVWQLQQKPPNETPGITVTLNSLLYVCHINSERYKKYTDPIHTKLHAYRETQYTKNMD